MRVKERVKERSIPFDIMMVFLGMLHPSTCVSRSVRWGIERGAGGRRRNVSLITPSR